MKKIKSLILAGIITASCFAGTISASAETTADDTAYIYVTDAISECSGEYPVPETPSAPALTAKVGDIIEVTVNLNTISDKNNFAGLWIMSFFGQEKAGDHEFIKDKVLELTDAYYGNGLASKEASLKTASVITNMPNFLNEDSNTYYYSHYGYTASTAYDDIYIDNTDICKYTLEVKKPGKTFINTTLQEVAYFDDIEYPHGADLVGVVDIKTSVAVVGNVNNKGIMGDVDGDGVLSIKDATLIQKYCAGIADFTAVQSRLADVNGDGDINIVDTTEIQKIIAKR